MMWTCYEMQRDENITVEKIKTGKRVSGSGAFTGCCISFILFDTSCEFERGWVRVIAASYYHSYCRDTGFMIYHYNLDVERYHDVSSRSALKKTESSFHILFFYYFLHNENHVWQEFLNIIRGIINSLCLTFIYSWKNSSSMKKNL